MATTIKKSASFYQLTPDDVLNAAEEAGYRPTGQFQQLNSYENRVFDIYLEDEPKRVIGKFYRPHRWSKDAILDEHRFLSALGAEGIDAISPYGFSDGTTLKEFNGILFSFYPRFSGRMPQEFLSGELKEVGRTLARIHNIGASQPAKHRPHLTVEDYGDPALETILDRVDGAVASRYEEAANSILDFLSDNLDPSRFIRIHGDCHKGNLLHNGERFFFVDFDDFVNGPVAQDFWMLISDESEKDEILSGYTELREFPQDQFDLFEPLRALRIIHYAAWIARRWDDPSFPKLFPEYGSYTYWAEEVEGLEKIAWSL